MCDSCAARPRRLGLWLSVLVAVATFVTPSASAGEGEVHDLLPDIVVDPVYLRDMTISPIELRVSNGTANVGPGTLEIRARPPEDDDPGRQEVVQRIYRSDGSFHERPAGRFIFHPTHNHVHIENWSVYRLREVLAGDEIGAVVAEGKKTSFCILDLRSYDPSLPNYEPRRRFPSCGSTVQGLTVGWVDIYSKNLDGQEISLLGVPDGVYWLESEVDPDDQFVESNEDNNIARRIVIIGEPEARVLDSYEPNETIAEVEGLELGWPNSANLGPVGPERVLNGLTITPGDVDVFRFFRPPGSGSSIAARPRIDVTSEIEDGRLEVELLNDDDEVVWRQSSLSGNTSILLTSQPEGWYSLRVSGIDGSTNPRYSIRFVAPDDNEAPLVEILSPAEEDVSIIHGVQNFDVLWEVSDPEGAPTWTSVYLNSRPELDGGEQLATTTLLTPSGLGGAIVSSAEYEEGTYYVYVETTDGSSASGVWADATLSFVEPPAECASKIGSADDCNGNGVRDVCEVDLGYADDCDANGVPDDCDLLAGALDRDDNGLLDRCEHAKFHRGDSNADGKLDVSDAVSVVAYLFSGAARPGCIEAANANNDEQVDISDGVFLLNHLFLGQPPPPFPGPPPGECGVDPDPVGSDADLGCDRFEACD